MADAIKALADATNALVKEKATILARLKAIDKVLGDRSTTTAKPKKAKKGKKKSAAARKKQSLAMKKAWAKRKKKAKK